MLPVIETAIINSNLGMNPMNNGELIMINVPPLTEERRKELVKQVKIEAENAKVSVRNSRKEANDQIKSLQDGGMSEDVCKDAEHRVQEFTNEYSKNIDRNSTRKRKRNYDNLKKCSLPSREKW